MKYFDPSETFDSTVKTAEQPVVQAIFTQECRLPDGTFTRVGALTEVPLDVAHTFAAHIKPEVKLPKPSKLNKKTKKK